MVPNLEYDVDMLLDRCVIDLRITIFAHDVIHGCDNIGHLVTRDDAVTVDVI